MPLNIASLAEAAAARHGVNPTALLTVLRIENPQGDPNAINPYSGATGLGQFMPTTAQQYGLTDPTNAAASIDAAARLMRDNSRALTRGLGRAPTVGEQYLAYQQGARGALSLLRNPDAPAASIVGAAAVQQNGGSADMTGSQFANLWTSRADQIAGRIPPADIPSPPPIPATPSLDTRVARGPNASGGPDDRTLGASWPANYFPVPLAPLPSVPPPLPSGQDAASLYAALGIAPDTGDATLALGQPAPNYPQFASVDPATYGSVSQGAGSGLQNPIIHPATVGDRAQELANALGPAPNPMDALSRAFGISPAEASTGPIKTADGIAGTVALPPGARPANLPPVPTPTFGNGGWDQFQLPAPTTTPAPPLPRPRPISADPLAQLLAGGAFPSYTGAGSLPDYPTAPSVNSPYSVSLPPPATVDHPGTILGGLSRNVDPASLQPAANALSGIANFIAPQNNGNSSSSQPFSTNWAAPYLNASIPSLPTSSGAQADNGGWGQYAAPAAPTPPPVPKTTTIQQQVLNPAYTQWMNLSGPNDPYQNAAFNYAMQEQAPAPPKYISVPKTVPNPKYLAPPTVPVPGVAPVVPLSPGQDVLAADRLAAENPLQRLFGMTPAGHLVNFLGGGLAGYGAPQQGGLLGLLAHGLGGSSAPAAPIAPTPSSIYAALAAPALASQPNGNINNLGNVNGQSVARGQSMARSMGGMPG